MLMSRAVDRLVPGPGTGWDRFAEGLQHRVQLATDHGMRLRIRSALSGEGWFGHPLHPALVVVPAGSWLVSAWYDAKSTNPADPEAEQVADATLVLGLISAVPAALSGIAQFVQTDGLARRVAAVHWALNAAAVALNGTSVVLRRRGSRPAGRRLSLAALALVGPGAYLGGHLVYRLGVGQPRKSS